MTLPLEDRDLPVRRRKDGIRVRIRKLDRDYDHTKRLAAGDILEEAEAKGQLEQLLQAEAAKPRQHKQVETPRRRQLPAVEQDEGRNEGPISGHGLVA